MPGMRYQPQGRVQIRPEWIARGLKFAYVPRAGFINSADQARAIQSSGDPQLLASPSGRSYVGGARGEFDLVVDARNGLTVIAILRAIDGSYTTATRALASSRNAGNGGWTWGRSGASGGFTRQQLVFQGVATFNETGYGIDPTVDTPVACRYDPGAGRVSFFRFGAPTSDFAAGAPRVSGTLVIGAQGPFSGNLLPWVDQAAGLLIIEGALRDDEIAQLSRSTSAFWQVFAADEDDAPAAATAASYALPVAPAVLGLTGGQVGIKVSRRLRATSAALAVSSGPVTVRAARSLRVQPAALAVAVQGGALRAGRRLRVDAAVLGLAGGQVGMQYAPAPAPGAYTLAVSAAAMTMHSGGVGMKVARRLAVAPAKIVIEGTQVSYILGARVGAIDASRVPPSRTVRFAGGKRVAIFSGGVRVATFNGGKRTVRF